MDPDETLRMLRGLLNDVTRDLDHAHSADDPYVDAAGVSELVDAVRGLDEWLSSGGFLPYSWRCTHGGAGRGVHRQEDNDQGRELSAGPLPPLGLTLAQLVQRIHRHEYQGQVLEHSHDGGDRPHGYFEHAEDAGGTSCRCGGAS